MLGIGGDRRAEVLEKASKRLEELLKSLKERGIDVGEVSERSAFEGPAPESPLKVAVFGEYNAGKSSLINALLGRNVSETGPVPTTDRIIEYVFSKGEERKELLDILQVGLPEEKLKKLRLVDLPGTNSLVEEHEKKVREYIKEADVVLFCSSAVQPLKESELRLLERFIEDGRRLVFVLTMADLKSQEELREIVSFVETKLHELFATRVRVIPVSSKAYIEKGTDAGMEELIEYINHQAQELQGKDLKEYRQTRQANFLMRVSERLREKLEAELSLTEEKLSKCQEIKRLIERDYQRIEDMLKNAEKSFTRHVKGASAIRDFVLDRFFKLLPKARNDSQEHILEKEYKDFKTRLSGELSHFYSSISRYYSVLELRGHLEDFPQVPFTDGKAFAGNVSRLMWVGLVLFVFLLTGSSSLLFSIIPHLILKLYADLVSIFLLLGAVALAVALHRGMLVRLYISYHLGNIRKRLLSFKEVAEGRIDSRCRELSEIKEFLEGALQSLNKIREDIREEFTL